MYRNRFSTLAIFLLIAGFTPLILAGTVGPVHAENAFTLTPLPAFTQEGNTVTLVLTVSNANATTYHFIFYVTDPANQTTSSPMQNYTARPGETFSIVVNYPSPSFSGTTSLCCQYNARADIVINAISIQKPVASTHFFILITDNYVYERSQTVNMRATGYFPFESVSVSIITGFPSTTVFSQTVFADSNGVVASSWRVPVNATTGGYVLSLTGSATTKSPPDAQPFTVKSADMTISSISTIRSTYQRTEILQFSFQPSYPDGSIATTGAALLTLVKPDGTNITFTATYDAGSQSFVITYQTSPSDQTGSWVATLGVLAYSDAYGNAGPSQKTTRTVQLTPATLSLNIATATSFSVGQQMNFNASITYPDGTALQSGPVQAYLLLNGVQAANQSVPMVYDTNLRLWVGTYTWKSTDSGGLWSLNIRASDSFTPPNTAPTATRAVILNNAAGTGNTSFPLYFFGIVAALIAAALLGTALLFKKRRKTTSASLKIDLEAVKSEAGRIEGQDFFQSIRDQIKKDSDE